MDTVDLREAKIHLSALLDRAAKGENITITKYGLPVAVLVPAGIVAKSDRIAAIEALKRFRKERKLDDQIFWEMIRQRTEEAVAMQVVNEDALWGKPVRIHTPRLILRDFEESDYENVHRYASDADVVKYCSFGPNSEEETRAYVQRVMERKVQEPRTHYDLAVIRKEDSSFMGAAGIYIEQPQNRSGEIGYVLHRDFWGQGYATEAARMLVDLGFTALSLHRIYAYVFEENKASRRVLEKVGMQQEGRLREDTWKNKRWNNVLAYAILEQEWRVLKTGEVNEQ